MNLTCHAYVRAPARLDTCYGLRELDQVWHDSHTLTRVMILTESATVYMRNLMRLGVVVFAWLLGLVAHGQRYPATGPHLPRDRLYVAQALVDLLLFVVDAACVLDRHESLRPFPLRRHLFNLYTEHLGRHTAALLAPRVQLHAGVNAATGVQGGHDGRSWLVIYAHREEVIVIVNVN